MGTDDLMLVAVSAGLLGVLALVFFLLGQRSKRRFDRLGEAMQAYGATRALAYTPLHGGYHHARGLGGPPSLKGTIEGVEIQITPTDGRYGDYTMLETAPPVWFPDGGGATIGVKDGTPSWLVGTTIATGDRAFDERFVFGMGPEDQALRFASPQVRSAMNGLAAASTFSSLSCFNVHGNRSLAVKLSGHTVDPPTLDAALAALVAVRRT